MTLQNHTPYKKLFLQRKRSKIISNLVLTTKCSKSNLIYLTWCWYPLEWQLHRKWEHYLLRMKRYFPFFPAIKFIYSEKVTNVCEISTLNLSYVVKVKSTVQGRFRKILWPSQNIWTLIPQPKTLVFLKVSKFQKQIMY